MAGGWEEEPADGAIEAAGEGDDLGGVDVATPFAVVGLLDRRDAGLVEAVAEERLESVAGLDLGPAGVAAGAGEVVGDDLVDGERRWRRGCATGAFADGHRRQSSNTVHDCLTSL